MNNDYPKELMEVIIVDGLSSDNTLKIVEEYSKKYSFIHLIENKNITVPFALNLGIQKSKGDYIVRLDAHSKIPKNYFSQLVEWSIKLSADNIGAVCLTKVQNSNSKTNAISLVLSNKFGVGNSYFRIGTNDIMEVDTVPFGCYKKEIFNKVGMFNVHLTRNQDIELNKRIKRIGGKIFLLSEVQCIYYARESYKGIAKNNYQTGLWNILTVYVTKKISSLSLRHFIPMVFLLSLIVPALLTIWFPVIGLLAALSFGSYLITLLIISHNIKNQNTNLFYVLYSFMVLHFSYGFGSLVGLFKLNYLFKADGF